MPAGYVIAQLKVTNPENYKEYVEKVPDVVKKYGGEYLARGGEHQVVEGEDNLPRIVIIKFPTYEKALESGIIQMSTNPLKTYVYKILKGPI